MPDVFLKHCLGGVQMGYRTILVLTGSTRADDLVKYDFQPDMIVDSMANLLEEDQLVGSILPTMNREDDTPMDMQEWIAAHSSP